MQLVFNLSRVLLILNIVLSSPLLAQKDTLINEGPPHFPDPYYIDTIPQIKLPTELRIDSIKGKIFASIKLDYNANILSLEWIMLLLKDKNNRYFIQYREAINKGYELQDYPLPIRPYVKLMQVKIKEIKFKRYEQIPKPKGDWYYTIPFKVY